MIKQILKKIGFRREKNSKIGLKDNLLHSEFEKLHLDIIQSVGDFTMTSPERIFALIEAVKYIIRNDIVGDFVECGVWKGGSLMTMIKALISINTQNRMIYGFD